MILYCLVFYIVFLAPASQKKTPEVTLNVQQRVNLLKRQISDQIKEKQRTSELILPINSDDEYVYVDIRNKPITPIMNNDKRKKHDKFKLREIVTAVTEEPRLLYSKERVKDAVQRSRIKKKETKFRVAKPIDSFYRRLLLTDEAEDTQWIHCQDLITPFLSGFKTDLTVTKRLQPNDHTVLRLLQLLSLNTTGHTQEEVYSILYQISNIQIRLFQWDVPAMNSLLNVIIKNNQPHTFKNVHKGLRHLLKNWHLDITNTTNLLRQARIFRPPCVRVSDYEGSTKTSKSFRYTTPGVSKSTCAVPGATCTNDPD